MGDFNLKKYIAEGKLLKELEVSDVNVKNDAENIMKEFIQAVEKSSNSEEIFEKFENWVNSFMPGAIKEDDEFDDPADRPAHEFDSFASADIEEANEDPNQKKYTEEEWKRELDLNVEMAKELLAYQRSTPVNRNWEDLTYDLIQLQKKSSIPSNIEFFKEWIESQEDNDLPNSSSGSFFTGLTDIDGLLSAMNFEEELEFDGESDEDLYLYTDEEYDKAVAYHNARLNQEVPDMFKY